MPASAEGTRSEAEWCGHPESIQSWTVACAAAGAIDRPAIILSMETPQKAVSAELRSAYDAALGGCLVVEHDAPGLLRLQGAGGLDFLQRMSTNALTGLSPGGMCGTVLTTAIGRTVDVVQVLHRPGDLLLLTTPGRAAVVSEWLNRYIFFNDDVRIATVPPTPSLLGIYGPGSAAVVEEIVGAAPAAPGLFLDFGRGQLWTTTLPLPGFQLLAEGGMSPGERRSWEGRSFGPSGLLAYEAIRVERGVPAVGKEIDEDVIPLEVGLWDLVSFSKGCYIGQEVIARMESRSRIARGLVGLRLDRLEEMPQQVLLGGQAIGRATSAALSPRFGPIGLALVRAAAAESGPGELVLSPSGGAVAIRPLPFDDTHA
jgi:aminomethyltransferase